MSTDLSKLSDEKLFHLYKTTGNDACFEIIYHRRENCLRRFLLKFLLPKYHEHIDDLIQTAFADLHRFSPVIGSNFSVNGWLLQAAEMLSRMLIRDSKAQKRFTGVAEAQVSDSDRMTLEDPAEEAARQEIADKVRAMVDLLPSLEQEAIYLTLEGYSRREAATKLGVTPGIFQCRLQRAMLALQGMTSTRLEAAIA